MKKQANNIHELAALAGKQLPKPVYDYMAGERAAAEHNTLLTLSSFSGKTLEKVAEATAGYPGYSVIQISY